MADRVLVGISILGIVAITLCFVRTFQVDRQHAEALLACQEMDSTLTAFGVDPEPWFECQSRTGLRLQMSQDLGVDFAKQIAEVKRQ